MLLNPYHPQRYWSHLARPQYHLDFFQETLDTLEHIQRLRIDDHVYRVATNVQLGNSESAEANVKELLEAFPEFNVKAFVDSLPYERDSDRQSILNVLQQTTLGGG